MHHFIHNPLLRWRWLLTLGALCLVIAGLGSLTARRTPQEDTRVFAGAPIKAIACARNNATAVVATTDRVVPLSPPSPAGTSLPIAPATALVDMALSADGSVLAMLTTRDRQFADVALYRGTHQIASLHILLELGAGSHLALSPAGTKVVLDGWKETLVWDTTLDVVTRLPQGGGAIRDGFTRRDDLVSTNGVIWPAPPHVPSDLLASESAQAGWAFSLAVHPTKAIVAIGAEDGRIRLFDLANHRLIQTIVSHTGTVTALAFNHDGTWLAAGGGWGMEGDHHGEPEIRIWDVATGQRVVTLTPPDTAEISDLCFIGQEDQVLALTQKPWSPFGNLNPISAHLWQTH
ncbi:MAG: WD40 repeat domain-containing protein [Chloroflexales bacterium]|nr:WD40 repeat domain-containing protein [Chloroflexales bacterium]